MALTKTQLVYSIHKKVDLPRTRSAKLVDSLLEIIKKTLGDGEDVLISGFGKFCVKEKGKRRGRNPQTGEDLKKDSLRHEDGTLQSSNGKGDDGDKAQLQILIEVMEGLLSQT